MIPLRLVLDTNVLVSAALKPQGLERTAFLLAISRPARLYISRSILEEYAEVLARPELKIGKGLRQRLLQLIRNRSYMVAAQVHLKAAGDADDNKFLECADAARADYLITGNQSIIRSSGSGQKLSHLASSLRLWPRICEGSPARNYQAFAPRTNASGATWA